MNIKKIYFDLYNLENDIKSKELLIEEYQTIFNDFISSYKDQNKNFADTFNKVEEMQKTISENLSKDLLAGKEPEFKPGSVQNTLFRNIVKVTHPDKQSQNIHEATKMKYDEWYKSAIEANEKNILFKLIYLYKLIGNNPFNIDYTDSDVSNLDSYKNHLENKLTDLKNSFIWKFMTIEDENELTNFATKHFEDLLKYGV